jgi:hypothetical protein
MSMKIKQMLSASPSKYTADETNKQHISSQMLPEIKGAIKNVKQLVK